MKANSSDDAPMSDLNLTSISTVCVASSSETAIISECLCIWSPM